MAFPSLLSEHGLDDDLVLRGQEDGPVDIGLAVHDRSSADEFVVGVKVAGLPLGILAVKYGTDERLTTADLIFIGSLAGEMLEATDADVVVAIGLISVGRQCHGRNVSTPMTNLADDVSHLGRASLLFFKSLPKKALLSIGVFIEIWDDAPFALRGEGNVLSWLVMMR